MIRLLTLMIIGLSTISCSNNKGGLDGKTQTLELTYIAWACDCANWAITEDVNLYHNNFDNSLAKSIFIEPANQSLKLPDTLGFSNDVIKFTGQFYNNKGFPIDYHSIENPEKARVFRYTDYEVVKSNFKDYSKYIVNKK